MSFKFEISEKWIIVKKSGYNQTAITALPPEAPKIFYSREDAEKWIEKHSYKGMNFRYEVEKI